MKKRLIFVLLTLLIVAVASFETRATTFTVATFSDPAYTNSNAPLFDVNYITHELKGGWADSKTGLTLQVPWTGNTFSDAWFKVNQPVTLSIPTMGFCSTGGGQIEFYKNNTNSNPLLVIQFDGGFMSSYGMSSNFTFANVTLSGSEISGTLSDEIFSFSFANKALLNGSSSYNDGFTATAAFTSSAVPEPATIGIVCAGVLAILRKKKLR